MDEGVEATGFDVTIVGATLSDYGLFKLLPIAWLSSLFEKIGIFLFLELADSRVSDVELTTLGIYYPYGVDPSSALTVVFVTVTFGGGVKVQVLPSQSEPYGHITHYPFSFLCPLHSGA